MLREIHTVCTRSVHSFHCGISSHLSNFTFPLLCAVSLTLLCHYWLQNHSAPADHRVQGHYYDSLGFKLARVSASTDRPPVAPGDEAALRTLGAEVATLQSAICGSASQRVQWSVPELASEIEQLCIQVGFPINVEELPSLPALQRTVHELKAELGY